MADVFGDNFGDEPSLSSEPGYVAQLGRISGKLLSDNLRRNGVDLSFRNGALDDDLLYLDVTNFRIGVNTSTPTHTLHNNGTARTTNLIVDGTNAQISNVVINTDGSFTTLVGELNIVPTSPGAVIEHERLTTSLLMFNDNTISGTGTDTTVELRPNGSGDLNINATTNIYGSLDVSANVVTDSNVSIQGLLTIGDTIFDTLTVNPDFTQSIIPGDNDLYNLGTTTKRWRSIYVDNNDFNDEITADQIDVGSQLRFQTNRITSIQSNDDITLLSDEGTIVFENISVKDNTITNLLTTPFLFSHTGQGYLKFDGSFGVLIPAGSTAERQDSAIGDTRWNTDLQYLECFDGTIWEVATGGGETVTQEFMQDLGHEYSLIFG